MPKYLAQRASECVGDNINTLVRQGLLKEAFEWCLFFAAWFKEHGMEATAATLAAYAQEIEAL